MQPLLFANDIGQTPNFQARDPNVMEADKPRLSSQNSAILERLKRGPATNDELIRLSRKYTSRISDLREAGFKINCKRGVGGLNTYTLEQNEGVR
jgi:hypothetical protein